MIAQLSAHKEWRGVPSRFAVLLGAFGWREALQAAFWIYLARHDSHTFGQFFLGLSLGQMVLVIVEFGLNQHLMAQLGRGHTAPWRLLKQAVVFKAALLGLVWLGLVAFTYWQGYSAELRAIVVMLAGGMGLEALASTYYVWLQVQGRQGNEAAIRMGASLLGFGLAFCGLWAGMATWLVAAYRLLESLAALLGTWALATRHLRGKDAIESRHSLWRDWGPSLVFAAMAMAAMFYNRLNVVFLERFGGEAALSQYGATWQLVDGLASLVVVLLLGNTMLPRFISLWQKDRVALIKMSRQAARWLLLASLALALLLAAASTQIMTLLYGPAYAAAGQLQKWLSAIVVLSIMHNLAGYLMIAMGAQRLLLVFMLAALLVNAVACATLIPACPLYGAVAAVIASKALLALLSLGYCQFRLGLLYRPGPPRPPTAA